MLPPSQMALFNHILEFVVSCLEILACWVLKSKRLSLLREEEKSRKICVVLVWRGQIFRVGGSEECIK